jgi:LacI family transcriptional regulator
MLSKKQITLADLARELGISTATVSRALKDYPDISAETKRRVVELASQMNYRPNSLAAGLRKRESNVIGVIIPSIVDHFFSSVIKGIMEVAYDAGYRVMLCQSDESYEKEVTDAQVLFDSRVDGLLVSIAHGSQDYSHFDEFLESGVPVVFFDKVPEQLDKVSKVVVNDFEGAYEASMHLLRQGIYPLAHLEGPQIASTSRQRRQGYLAALAQAGHTPDESLILTCQDMTLEEGAMLARRLMAARPDCQGIFAVTDTIALGALTALKALGLRSPEQVAVIGFSDWTISAIFEPPLSSVAQPGLEMGRIAAGLLLREIQAEKQAETFLPETIVLPTTLQARRSSLRSPRP